MISTKTQLPQFSFRRILAAPLVFLFLLNQVVPVSFAASPTEQEMVTNRPTKTLEELQETTVPNPVSAEALTTSQAFLADDLKLEKPEPDSENQKPAEQNEIQKSGDSESQKPTDDSNPPLPQDQKSTEPQAIAPANPFKDAIDHLFEQTAGVAIAVVQNITQVARENIQYVVDRAIDKGVEILVAVALPFSSRET